MSKNTEEVQEATTFELPNKTVLVKPIRGRSWLPKGHEAEFLFGDSYIEYVTPENERGGLIDPLTPQEREFFEDKNKSGMTYGKGDLSIYKKEDNFWKSFTIKLNNRVLPLDLSNPMDYLRYKILIANRDFICPTGDKNDIARKYSYKFYIANEGEETQREATGIGKVQAAYKAFGRMEGSNEEMINFLKQYKLRKPAFKKFIPDDAKTAFLVVEIDNIIKSDITTFLDIVEDPLYSDKKLLIKALETGAVEVNGRAYTTPEGVHLGDSSTEAIKFINAKVNNEIKLQIIGRIENAK